MVVVLASIASEAAMGVGGDGRQRAAKGREGRGSGPQRTHDSMAQETPEK
jgi:hypothetical protein